MDLSQFDMNPESRKEFGDMLACLNSKALEGVRKDQVAKLDGASFSRDVQGNISLRTISCLSCDAQAPTSRCARCKNALYCSRKCQISHWVRHKPFCAST
jgi:uncharacterized paraquat-inducible protein A